uniref:CSON015426 protein n=1 Tax=Culicoides sonorensis TaxID=179676 RepID=A0A336LPT7_CULSO
MPSSCVVASCINKYNHEQDVSFHKFPSDQILCQKWIEFSGRTDWRPTRWSSICSRHFEKNCFKKFLMRKCLRPDAIPTLAKDGKEQSGNKSCERNDSLDVSTPKESIRKKRKFPEFEESNSEVNEEEVITTEYDDETPENDYVDQLTQEENDETVLEDEADLERLVVTLCRLCAGTFELKQLVSYSSFLNLIIKCFPTLNLENYEYFPKQICTDCREKLISFSIFIDKTMAAQNYLTDKLVHNLPNISENFFDNKKIMPRIKQEPIVVIKEEKIDKKIEFCGKTKGTLHGLKDKITFKDSKHCEIIKIVNLNTPLIDLKNNLQPSSPQRNFAEAQININQSNLHQKRVTTPHVKALDDDIEILSPTPMKVEEIIEGDDIEEIHMEPQIPLKVDHNYSRSPYTGKIEILEERVFKTEITEPTLFGSITSGSDDTNYELNRLCSICNFIFDSSQALKQHNLDNHSESISSSRKENFRVCTLCNTGFRSIYTYLQHKQELHGKKRIFVDCRHCGKIFISRKILMKHIKFSCSVKFKNSHKKSINFTREEIVEEVLDTEQRNKSSGQETNSSGENLNMRQMIEEASQEDYLYVDEPLNKDIVEKVCINRSNHCTTLSKTCQKCGRLFSSNNLMLMHQRNHRPSHEWDKKCRFCEKIFDQSNDLNWHVRHTCTGVKELKMNIPSTSHTFYACSICGISVSSLWSLKNHENIHTKKITYKCKYPNCNKSFISKQNLAQHNMSHSEERNYKCHLCTRSYKRPNGLNQHINSFHLNLKPHICSICKKSYSLKSDMLRCKHSLLKYLKT